MIDWVALTFGSVMASIDVLSLGIVKNVSGGSYKMWTMAIATAMYALQPWIFLSSLSGSSLTIMNLMWDLTSDIMVTLVGLFYFREKIGHQCRSTLVRVLNSQEVVVAPIRFH
jgi:hypothetical protein